MKIAFWSNVKGKGCVTANMIAISALNTIICDDKNLIFENHTGIGGLNEALIFHDEKLVKESSYDYNNLGMDLLIRKLKAGVCEERGIDNNVKSFYGGKLLYVPRRQDISGEVFEFEMNIVIDKLLKMFEKYADKIFIDTSVHSNQCTKKILDISDIIVVNICQNRAVLDDIFNNHKDILHKTFFVIGSYDDSMKFNVNSIMKKYRIDNNHIATIPYNSMFRDALGNGTITDFISKFYGCRKRDKNYYFISCVMDAATKLQEISKKCI